MEKEERLRNKLLYKVELLLIKYIPMIIALLYLINSVLSYLSLDVELISIVGGVSILTWVFLFISSLVFKFCLYHRLFLYYIAVEELIAWYDYKIGIPLTNVKMFVLDMTIAGIFMFLIVYFKVYGTSTEEVDNQIP